MSEVSLLQAAMELVNGFVPVLLLIVVSAIIGLASSLIRRIRQGVAGEDYDKPKNQSPLDWFSVPYNQDLDDEKPKRQTYMTIGDDGELVEMDE